MKRKKLIHFDLNEPVAKSATTFEVSPTINTLILNYCPKAVFVHIFAVYSLSKCGRKNFQIRKYVNCPGIPANLFESELFGHVKGAFTGAVQNRKGFFQTAEKGCLFLDEISELPLELQAKFLRVLQEKEIFRLGETQLQKIDV